MWRDEQGRRELELARAYVSARARQSARATGTPHTHELLNAIIRRATHKPSIYLPASGTFAADACDAACMPTMVSWSPARQRGQKNSRRGRSPRANGHTARNLFKNPPPRLPARSAGPPRAQKTPRYVGNGLRANPARARQRGGGGVRQRRPARGARDYPSHRLFPTCRWQGRVLSSTYHRWHSMRCWSANGLRLRQRRCTWRFVIDALVGEYALR